MLDRGQLVSGSGGRLWCDGAIFDVTERRAAEEARAAREIEQARSEELHASRARIVEAADAARRKIERDLHDGAQQRLVALALEVRMARARVDKDPDAAGPFLERVGQELTEASAELRELARGIHPAVLTERGLAPAISALVSRAPVPVDIVELPEDRFPSATEATAYFTVAEALTNVAKYAEPSHATVRIARENGVFAVEVRDDGKGGAQATPGSGLAGLADRVGAPDGVARGREPARRRDARARRATALTERRFSVRASSNSVSRSDWLSQRRGRVVHREQRAAALGHLRAVDLGDLRVVGEVRERVAAERDDEARLDERQLGLQPRHVVRDLGGPRVAVARAAAP